MPHTVHRHEVALSRSGPDLKDYNAGQLSCFGSGGIDSSLYVHWLEVALQSRMQRLAGPNSIFPTRVASGCASPLLQLFHSRKSASSLLLVAGDAKLRRGTL